MFNSGRLMRLLFGAVILLSALFCVVVLWDIVPIVRGPEAWRWWLLPMPSLGKIALTGGALLLLVTIWWGLGRRLKERPTRAQCWISLTTFAILTLIVQFAFLSLYRSNPAAIIFERLASDQASGYFTVAVEIDHWPTLLKEYPERMQAFRPDPHPRSKPPGIVLLNWGAIRLMERVPAVSQPIGHWARGVRCADLWLVGQSDGALAGNVLVGIFTLVVSSLVIWPAYGLAARSWGTKGGWLAAGLVALMPGRWLFAPHLDTVYPFLTLLALYLADTGIRRDRLLWTAAAGFVLSIATFFSLVNGLAAVLVGLYLVLRFLPDRRWNAMVGHALALAGGGLFIWVVYWLYSGVTPFDIYAAAGPARHDLERSYWLWLVGNVYDFAVFVGLPVFLSAVLWTIFQWDKRKFLPLALAYWAVFLVVDISGAIRGEVGRIWLMLAPIPALLAAHPTQPTQSTQLPNYPITRLPFTHLALLSITAFSLWTMSLRWEVTRLEWPPPIERVMETGLPDRTLINMSFGPDIELAGYDHFGGDLLVVNLYWQAYARPDIAYTVFVHVVDEDGNIVVQQDVMPQNGRLPTTCWQPTEVVIDTHELDLTLLGPGTYQVVVGLYDQETATRLGEVILKPEVILSE
jgi:hypothetical protein